MQSWLRMRRNNMQFHSSTAFFLILSMACLIIASNAGPDDHGGVLLYDPAGEEGSLRIEDCPAACEYRCSATSYKKPCLFYCNMCCEKCLCVPSGTYGHKEECPCYNNWKTKRGGPKCP